MILYLGIYSEKSGPGISIYYYECTVITYSEEYTITGRLYKISGRVNQFVWSLHSYRLVPQQYLEF